MSITHPSDGLVNPKSRVNVASQKSMFIGKSPMNGREIADNLQNAVVANPPGSNKTQEQKMKEAGIDLKIAGLDCSKHK